MLRKKVRKHRDTQRTKNTPKVKTARRRLPASLRCILQLHDNRIESVNAARLTRGGRCQPAHCKLHSSMPSTEQRQHGEHRPPQSGHRRMCCEIWSLLIRASVLISRGHVSAMAAARLQQTHAQREAQTSCGNGALVNAGTVVKAAAAPGAVERDIIVAMVAFHCEQWRFADCSKALVRCSSRTVASSSALQDRQRYC